MDRLAGTAPACSQCNFSQGSGIFCGRPVRRGGTEKTGAGQIVGVQHSEINTSDKCWRHALPDRATFSPKGRSLLVVGREVGGTRALYTGSRYTSFISKRSKYAEHNP